MRITLHKFGTTLTSRQAGSEAYKVLQLQLKNLTPEETIEMDFDGVHTLSPSWADEFITPLYRAYGARLVLFPSANLSVQATLRLLKRIGGWDGGVGEGGVVKV